MGRQISDFSQPESQTPGGCAEDPVGAISQHEGWKQHRQTHDNWMIYQ